MQIIPAMDLIDNQVVRLIQGDYNQKTIYSNNPIEQAKIFYENGLRRIHLVDLSGAKSGRLEHGDLIKKIKNSMDTVIEYGGGIRDFTSVHTLFKEVLNPKEDFVMIGSLPFKNKKEFQKIIDQYRENVLLTVDVWDYHVKISGWQEDTQVDLFDFIKEMISLGIENYLVTQIKKDGMLSGPDFELYEKILKEFQNIRLIASGGVSIVSDLIKLKEINMKSGNPLFGAILGKAYYEKKIQFDDLKSLK